MYNLTYTSLVNMFSIEDTASNGILAHGIVLGAFTIIFLSLLGKLDIGKSLMVAGLSTFIFSVILVGVGFGNPSDMIIMLIFTLIGVMLR